MEVMSQVHAGSLGRHRGPAVAGIARAIRCRAPPSGRPGHHGGFGPMSAMTPSDSWASRPGLGGKTVTGAPFSATFSTQTTQTSPTAIESSAPPPARSRATARAARAAI